MKLNSSLSSLVSNLGSAAQIEFGRKEIAAAIAHLEDQASCEESGPWASAFIHDAAFIHFLVHASDTLKHS